MTAHVRGVLERGAHVSTNNLPDQISPSSNQSREVCARCGRIHARLAINLMR